MTGRIINITRYCLHDGRGIRTTVFLKGCPLACLWCHNPESQAPKPEITFDKRKCVTCGACVAACPKGNQRIENGVRVFDRKSCDACSACVAVCPTEALVLEGKTVCANEVVADVEKDKAFYGFSGGGVTVSGGEPLYQPEFVCEILRGCREKGIQTAIETCGFSSPDVFRRVIALCDEVLIDLKETDPERHLRYTGKPLQPILDNLAILGESGIPFTLRLPIVPGLNDRPEHLAAAKEIAGHYPNCEKTEVMPYHELGVYKYELLGRPYSL